MPNGILIIDKPRDWTSQDVCTPKTLRVFGEPFDHHARGK